MAVLAFEAVFRLPIEFSCRPDLDDRPAVRQTALYLNRLHQGGQPQRFVIHTHFFIPLWFLAKTDVSVSTRDFSFLGFRLLFRLQEPPQPLSDSVHLSSIGRELVLRVGDDLVPSSGASLH
jgi:hypothetical protein